MSEEIMLYEEGQLGIAATLDEQPGYKVALVIAAVLLALASFFLLGAHFSEPEAYSETIASLDSKKADVTALVAASTAASAAITVIPGDAGTPIAEKLVDLSSDFIIVLTAIYLEKYLLTMFGFAAFKILIPIACVLVAVAVALRGRYGPRAGLARLSAKLALFAVAIVLVVPVSVGASNMIEATYAESMNATIEAAKQTASEAEASVAASSATSTSDASGQSQSAGSGTQANGDTNEALGFLNGLIGQIQQLPQNISEGVGGLTQEVQNTLNNFIEAFAIMIVTSCVIPILVLIFFLWVVKIILGIDISAPMGMLRPRVLGKH